MGLGISGAARWLRRLVMLLVKPELRRHEIEKSRRDRAYHNRFLQFKRLYGGVLRYPLNTSRDDKNVVLVVGVNFPEVEIELGLIKALELAGFLPVALVVHRRLNLEYYRLAGIHKLHVLSEYSDPPDLAAAGSIIERYGSVQDLSTFQYAGTRAGLYAASTALRQLRVGSLDFRSQQDRQTLARYLAAAMAAATAAARLLQTVRPMLALFHDRVYTPEGELFDVCWANAITAIKWHPAHKSNALMLKRYTLENRDEHPVSLSSKSWEFVREMEWKEARHQELQRELYGTYASGDWYSEAGTQFQKRFQSADDIRAELGIDLSKKTAFIFPHIFWDASLNWGKDLFTDYEEWLVETVRAACQNDRVNWIVKIHPANAGKSLQEGYRWEPAEAKVLREHIGPLPPHVSMIPADGHISTLSLLDIMDYCLTVRGTIGIEAARLGIPVLTAGTGRFDHKGFTVDSETRAQYLERLAHIQEIPRLSATQIELAERYAYGLFILRPLPLETVTFRYPERENRDGISIKVDTQINVRRRADWHDAPDLKAFADWVKDSSEADFLTPLSEE